MVSEYWQWVLRLSPHMHVTDGQKILIPVLSLKDKILIEKVQIRFTKMIPSVKLLSYEDRLKQLNLWSLEDRRIRADLIDIQNYPRTIIY